MKKFCLCLFGVLLALGFSLCGALGAEEGYKNMCDATADAVGLSLEKKGIGEHGLSGELLQKHIEDRGQMGEIITPIKDGVDMSLFTNQYLLAAMYGLEELDVNVNNMYRINMEDREAVKEAVNTYGGVIISYCYTGDYVRGDNNSYYSAMEQKDINRQAVIVGWEDGYLAGSFNAGLSNNGAWLIKDTAFEKGYAYISYNEPSIGQAALALDCDKADKGDYDKIYQFDGGYSHDKDIYFGHTGYMCNTFISNREESLEYVSFFVNSNAQVEYEIKVYLNSKNRKNPTAGYMATVQNKKKDMVVTGTTAHPGYYTVKLKEPIMLGAEDEFSIVVRLKSKENVYLPIDTSSSVKNAKGEEILDSQVNSYERQSYVSMDGVSWEEISLVGNMNVRIKAFTKVVNSPSGNGKFIAAIIITVLLYGGAVLFFNLKRKR